MCKSIILFIILVLLFSKDSFRNLTYYQKLVVLCLFSIVFAIHGFLHLGMETLYDYNPLENKENKLENKEKIEI